MTSPQLEELNLLHANICQALGDPKRIQILYALHEQPRRVSDLAADLAMPQPTVSRHLTVLRQRALLMADRNGNEVTYSLAEPGIIDVLDAMRQILRNALERQSSYLD